MRGGNFDGRDLMTRGLLYLANVSTVVTIWEVDFHVPVSMQSLLITNEAVRFIFVHDKV